MLAVVGAVSTCVYVYSLGYMDPRVEGAANVRRFFCFLDFFVASMALLVLAGNIAVLLIGWTGVGISSFLLITFWTRSPARSAPASRRWPPTRSATPRCWWRWCWCRPAAATC